LVGKHGSDERPVPGDRLLELAIVEGAFQLEASEELVRVRLLETTVSAMCPLCLLA
jgi:hypothetical protein